MNWGRFDGLIVAAEAGDWEWFGSCYRRSDGMRFERWASKCSVCGVRITALATLLSTIRQQYFEARKMKTVRDPRPIRLVFEPRRKALLTNRCAQHRTA